MKIKVLLYYIIAFLLVLPIVSAAWQVHSSWSLNTKNTNPADMTSNATSTAAGDLWIVEFMDKRVYHYRPDGTYVDNFSAAQFTGFYPYAIWVNTTSGSATNLYITDTNYQYIWVTNSTGGYVRNISISPLPDYILNGIASNATTNKSEEYWANAFLDNKIYKLNSTGGLIDSCSIAGFSSGKTYGLTTNSSGQGISYLWTTDWLSHKVYKITPSCVLVETINLGDLGITSPVGVETYYKNTVVNDLLVVSETADKVYRLKYTDDYPGYSGQAQKYTSINQTNITQLNITCTDDIDIATAYLADNSSGTWANCTSPTCNSPLSFAGASNTSVIANFSWVDMLTSSTSNAVAVNWTVQCVDSGGQSNVSSALQFKATPIQGKCYNSQLNISSITTTNAQNISVSFTGSGSDVCAMYMPAIIGAGQNISCNYKVSNSTKVRLYNSSGTTCVVNATFTSVASGFSARVDIATELGETFPPNIPVVIAIAATVGIVYIVTVVSRRRRST